MLFCAIIFAKGGKLLTLKILARFVIGLGKEAQLKIKLVGCHDTEKDRPMDGRVVNNEPHDWCWGFR